MAEIPALVRLLRSSRRTEQRQAALTVMVLAAQGSPAGRTQLVDAGCVPPLLKMVSSGSWALQAPAVGALAWVSVGSDSTFEACTPAIPSLVSCLGGVGEHPLSRTAMLLSNMAARHPGRCAAIVAAGGHTALLRLISSSEHAAVRRQACSALARLACVPASRAVLIDSAALPALVSMLQQPGSGGSSGDALEEMWAVSECIRAIANLLFDESSTPKQPAAAAVTAAVAATAAGVPAAIMQQLRWCSDQVELLAPADSNALGIDAVARAAARAVHALAGSSDSGVLAAVDAAGGAPALAEQLCCDARSPDALAALLEALVMLTYGSHERCAALAAVPGVLPRLVQLLRGAAGPRVQVRATALLAHIVKWDQIAAAAAAAGVVPALAVALTGSVEASGDCSEVEVQSSACTLAHVLADAGKSALLLAGGLADRLQQLAASSDPALSQLAAGAVQALASPPCSAAAAAPAAEPASGQPQRPRRTCDGPECSATRGLRLCGGCGTVRYCSEACSRAHWKAHRAECRRVQAEKAAAAGAAGSEA